MQRLKVPLNKANTDVKTCFEAGIQLKKESKIDAAVAKFASALKLDANFVPALNQLAEIYANRQELSKSVQYYQRVVELMPRNSVTYARLAKVKSKLGDVQEAIHFFQKAIALKCDQPIWVYVELGNALEQNQQLDEAISVYQKIISLKSSSAFNIESKLQKLLKSKQKSSRAVTVDRSSSQVQQEELYLKIWQALNQTNLNADILQKSVAAIDLQKVNQYFFKTSKYKIINLSSATRKDKTYLAKLGMSLKYLNLNKAGLISEDKSILSKYDDSLNSEYLPPQVVNRLKKNEFQLSIVNEGCLHAVCPFSGNIIKSNRSLVSLLGHTIFYRFASNGQVFYLVTGRATLGFTKLCLYFPRHDTIVVLDLLPISKQISKLETFNQFKAYLVHNSQKITSYLRNNEVRKVKIVALISSPQFAHHLWNELSGIYKLYEAKLLHKVDQFLVVSEPLGSINKIFPEIPPEKIKRIQKKELTKEIVDNNSFVLRLGHNFIREDLANRIYQLSLKQCSTEFLNKIRDIRKSRFPLLWVSLRFQSRAWVSQIEGIANILNSLSKKFPNLGVVIDGFSLPYNSPVYPGAEQIIAKEQQAVAEIKSYLSSNISLYSTIGNSINESIIWAHNIDLYLANHGTIQHKVGWTANKPGVVHGNSRRLSTPLSEQNTAWARENAVIPIGIDKQHIFDLTENIGKNGISNLASCNYDCDWKIMYQELLKLILELDKN